MSRTSMEPYTGVIWIRPDEAQRLQQMAPHEAEAWIDARLHQLRISLQDVLFDAGVLTQPLTWP